MRSEEKSIEPEFDKKYPYISVIITAHDRKEFIEEAIYSVINQTVNRALYEIIVVKNFDDQKIDKLLVDNDIINLRVKVHSSIGEDLSIAVEKAKGEVITFLDDDDLFMANKLEIIYKTFKEFKDLSYLHNNEYFIDDKGNQAKFWLANFNEDIFLNDIKRFSEIWELQKMGLVFNMSSISIKKNKIIGYLEQLKEINTNQDDFMFLVSTLERDSLIILSKEKLTKYRLHNSSTINLSDDMNEFLNHKIQKLMESISEETKIIIIVNKKRMYKLFVRVVLILDKINLYLLDNNTDIQLNDLLFYSLMAFKIKGFKSKRDCLYYLTLIVLSKISYDRVHRFYIERSFKYNLQMMEKHVLQK
jgi:glycosyltransferase involved in cell wall biosynthesis